MVAILFFFQMAPILKEKSLGGATLLCFKSVSGSFYELESGNQNVVDRQMNGRRTHQSNRRVGYKQPTQKYQFFFSKY